MAVIFPLEDYFLSSLWQKAKMVNFVVDIFKSNLK